MANTQLGMAPKNSLHEPNPFLKLLLKCVLVLANAANQPLKLRLNSFFFNLLLVKIVVN